LVFFYSLNHTFSYLKLKTDVTKRIPYKICIENNSYYILSVDVLSNGPITRERLDRAMANDSWVGLFDVVEVQVLPRNILDDNPLLVSFSNSMDIQWSKSRMFRYEACWAK
jgi:hypothetical protein